MRPLAPHDAGQAFIWRSRAETWPALELPGVGRLRLRETAGAGLRADVLAGGWLTVRFRTGGERLRPLGRRHRQDLKKLLQGAAVPPWERDRLPLLYKGDALLAAVGLGVAADCAADADAIGWQPILDRP